MANPNASLGTLSVLLIIFDLILNANTAALPLTLKQCSEKGRVTGNFCQGLILTSSELTSSRRLYLFPSSLFTHLFIFFPY